MNIVSNNEIVDKKVMDAQERTSGKIRQTELKEIYGDYSQQALGQVKQIKASILSQAFKKRMQQESKALKQETGDNENESDEGQADTNLIVRAKKKIQSKEKSKEGLVKELPQP